MCVSYLLYPLIHPSVDGHLYRSPVLDTVNSAAINMCVFELAFSLDICPGVGLQDQMVAVVLVFYGTSILFPILAVKFMFPPTV